MKDKPAMRYGPKDCFPTDLEIGPGRGMACPRSCLRRSCRPHGDSALTILLFSRIWSSQSDYARTRVGAVGSVPIIVLAYVLYLTFSTIGPI